MRVYGLSGLGGPCTVHSGPALFGIVKRSQFEPLFHAPYTKFLPLIASALLPLMAIGSLAL